MPPILLLSLMQNMAERAPAIAAGHHPMRGDALARCGQRMADQPRPGR